MNNFLHLIHAPSRKVLIPLLLAAMAIGAMAEKHEPELEDLGFFRNIIYSKQRDINYYVTAPQGTDMWECANKQSQLLCHLPYGNMLKVIWCDEEWSYIVSCDKKKDKSYTGYVHFSDIGMPEYGIVSNKSGARVEENISDFKRKKANVIMPYGSAVRLTPQAAEFGFFIIHDVPGKSFLKDYFIRTSDVSFQSIKPVALKKKVLPSYIIQSKEEVHFYEYIEIDKNGRHITYCDSTQTLPNGTEVYRHPVKSERKDNLVLVSTIYTTNRKVGLVHKHDLKMIDGNIFKRGWNNLTKAFFSWDVTDNLYKRNIRLQHQLYDYFDKQTNNPHKTTWQRYKWHFWGILLWMFVAYLLLIMGTKGLTNSWIQLFTYFWGFFPPQIYLLTNPHSLWFVDPSCIPWILVIVGLVFFIFIVTWLWINFKSYCIAFAGSNFLMKIISVLYGWGCLLIIITLFGAISEQDLILLFLVLIAGVAGPIVKVPDTGTLISNRGERVEGHFDGSDRFFGNDGKIYKKDFGSDNWHE